MLNPKLIHPSAAIVGGVVISLLSYFVTSAVTCEHIACIDSNATWTLHGFPVSWYSTGGNGASFDYAGFIINSMVWIIVFILIIAAAHNFRAKTRQRS